jgi:hypothetical protein
VDSKQMLETALTVLVAAEGRYPYGFYMLLRTATTVCARTGRSGYQAGPKGWLWAFWGAALMNPVLPIEMHREDWQPVDLGLGVLLLCWSGYWVFLGQRMP